MPLPNRLKTPSFLQKLQWAIDPIAYMESAVKKYPDIFTAEIIGFGDTIVFVHHPQAIQEILVNEKNKFVAIGEVNKTFQPFLGDSSIIMLESESHKRRRKMLIPPFHGEQMRAHGQTICALTTKILSQLPAEKFFKASDITHEISLQVILQVLFGLYQGEGYQKIKHQIPLVMKIFHSPLTSSYFLFPFLQKKLGAFGPWSQFLNQRQQLDELLYAEIAERKEQNVLESIDILSQMIQARDENNEPMTDQELRDELMTLIFAGHETTATTIAWSLYWIHQNPEVREKLIQEIDSLGDSPDPMSIVQLPYLTAVCNETLRICPVGIATFSRAVRESVELLGHKLEPDTIVQCCIYLTHYRKDLYPEPKKFKPERFLERQFSPYEFLPFGGGIRKCIGQAFAMFQMKLVIATILSRCQLALADKRPERLQRKGLAVGPANGVNMVITKQRRP
jgi:cytochrome P450 family 110